MTTWPLASFTEIGNDATKTLRPPLSVVEKLGVSARASLSQVVVAGISSVAARSRPFESQNPKREQFFVVRQPLEECRESRVARVGEMTRDLIFDRIKEELRSQLDVASRPIADQDRNRRHHRDRHDDDRCEKRCRVSQVSAQCENDPYFS